MNPKVFISYSHDSEDYKNWIRSFADRLTSQGIVITLDQYDLALGEMFPNFMEKGVSENDYVLLFLSKAYIEKTINRKGGVGYEVDLATGEIITSKNRSKFIPILVQADFPDMPPFLKGASAIKINNLFSYENEYDQIYATITRQTPQKPTLGPIRKMASDSEKSDPFDVDTLGLSKELDHYCYWDVYFTLPELKDSTIPELYSALKRHMHKENFGMHVSIEPAVLNPYNVKTNFPEIIFESGDYSGRYSNVISHDRFVISFAECHYSYIEYNSQVPHYHKPDIAAMSLMYILPMLDKVHADLGAKLNIDCTIKIKSNVDAIYTGSDRVLPAALRIGEHYVHKKGVSESMYKITTVETGAVERFFNRILETFVSTADNSDEPFLQVVHKEFAPIYDECLASIP